MVIYSTKPGWYSYEAKPGAPSIFTEYLVKGLSGAASKGKGVTAKDLGDWIPGAVASYALDAGIKQKPVVVLNNDAFGSTLLSGAIATGAKTIATASGL